jgi:hypothetical protein
VLFFPVNTRPSAFQILLVHQRASFFHREEFMKRLLFLGSLAVLFFFAFFSSLPAQTPSGPSMVLPERSFDFQEVEEGRTVEHAFKVLNRGDQPLEITNVNPG